MLSCLFIFLCGGGGGTMFSFLPQMPFLGWHCKQHPPWMWMFLSFQQTLWSQWVELAAVKYFPKDLLQCSSWLFHLLCWQFLVSMWELPLREKPVVESNDNNIIKKCWGCLTCKCWQTIMCIWLHFEVVDPFLINMFLWESVYGHVLINCDVISDWVF